MARANIIKALVITVPPRAHLDAMLRAVAGPVFSQERTPQPDPLDAHRRLYRPAPPRD
jgi:hypothetical protein